MIFVCPQNRLEETLPLGQRFFAMAQEHGQFNPYTFIKFWNRMHDTKSGFMLVNETNGVIDGAYGVVIQDEFLTGDRVATEVFWYSEGSAGLKLFKKAEEMAKKCGAVVMYIQHFNNLYSEKIMNYYAKNGFKLRYLRHVKEL